jgi:hypothetical protein
VGLVQDQAKKVQTLASRADTAAVAIATQFFKVLDGGASQEHDLFISQSGESHKSACFSTLKVREFARYAEELPLPKVHHFCLSTSLGKSAAPAPHLYFLSMEVAHFDSNKMRYFCSNHAFLPVTLLRVVSAI